MRQPNQEELIAVDSDHNQQQTAEELKTADAATNLKNTCTNSFPFISYGMSETLYY
jgi:hypothetical protein